MRSARAWVITREGPSAPRTVIAIVSARRGEEFIKHTLELLCGLLHYNAEEQLAAARWNNPDITYRAAEMVPRHTTAYHCGPNPFLIARLAREIQLDTSKKVPKLTWQEPDRFALSASGPVQEAEGSMVSAPVQFLFRPGRKWPHTKAAAAKGAPGARDFGKVKSKRFVKPSRRQARRGASEQL